MPVISVELKLLIWSVGLTVAQMLVATFGAIQQFGLRALAGNREDMPRPTGWVGRATRAHHNMLENLVLFAVLVVSASIMERINAMTALGAELFFWGRVAYSVIYIAGVPWLRTAAFLTSVAGLVLIFSQLI